ncbi:MAG: hypothetical protein R3C24_07125 [Cyanobacteriota/Melainabacteria group bacterium]
MLYGSPEEPIEFDSPSTIADVDVAECCDYLELDGAYLSSLNFSDLPRAACPGWFTRHSDAFPFTLSVHLSRAEIEKSSRDNGVYLYFCRSERGGRQADSFY